MIIAVLYSVKRTPIRKQISFCFVTTQKISMMIFGNREHKSTEIILQNQNIMQRT